MSFEKQVLNFHALLQQVRLPVWWRALVKQILIGLRVDLKPEATESAYVMSAVVSLTVCVTLAAVTVVVLRRSNSTANEVDIEVKSGTSGKRSTAFELSLPMTIPGVVGTSAAAFPPLTEVRSW
jgi:hypothetical protein